MSKPKEQYFLNHPPPPTNRAATLSGTPYRELLFYSLSGYKGV